MEMIGGIIMFIIGMFFLFLFILKYQNEFEKENQKPKQLEKFKKQSIPALVCWSGIAIVGLGIVAYHLFI